MPSLSSVPGFRLLLIGVYVASVALLFTVAAATLLTLSAARAYVAGESLWSKAQKAAVAELRRYVAGGDEAALQRYKDALAVPLGDHRARIELDRPTPDLARVREGFIAGGNHPDDVPGMIRLYRWFGGSALMADSIDAWAEGDRLIAALDDLARQVVNERARGDFDAARQAAVLEQIDALDRRLTDAERRFSQRLGDAAGQRLAVLMLALGGMAALIAAAGAWFIGHAVGRRQQAEAALQARNAEWELAARAVGMGVLDWDTSRDHVRLDPRARALCGADDRHADALPLRGPLERVHPDDREHAQRTLRAAAADHGEPFTLRCRVGAPEAGARHLELMGAPQHGADGNVRVVGIVRDVSGQVRIEQLQREKDAAERSARAKTEFLSRVSHELRTPLNAVIGFAQLMQIDRDEPLGAAQARRVEHILGGGRHLLELVNDVLDLTGADASGLVSREVSLADVLSAAIERVEPLRALHGIELAGPVGAADLVVLADPRRLRQVFVSLLANAIGYNRPGGRVSIECRADDAGVRVAVADTGAGLSSSQLARLFQPFERADADTPRSAGTGLGLAIARALLERMGGSIEATSSPGAGSVFTVRLRRA